MLMFKTVYYENVSVLVAVFSLAKKLCFKNKIFDISSSFWIHNRISLFWKAFFARKVEYSI